VSERTDHGTIPLGGVVHYTIVVVNHGPADAHDVVVIDAKKGPPRTLTSVAGGGAKCNRKLPLRCTLRTLKAAHRVTIRVAVRPTGLGQLRNTASVKAPGADPHGANNRHTVRTRVRAGHAVLRLTKRADRRRVTAGETVRYRISVRNASHADALGVRVCDEPPASMSIRSAPHARVARGQACWTIAGLPAGHARTFMVRARVYRAAAGGPAANSASARPATRGPGPRAQP
jgi:uncharacterized repeat protein (TIGR01451 family)